MTRAELSPAGAVSAYEIPAAAAPELSPWMILGLAACLGLVGGFLDLGSLVLIRYGHKDLYLQQGSFFLWAIPLANMVFVLVPGVVLVVAACWRTRRVPLRTAAWLFVMLGLCGPLLRLPLYGAVVPILASGMGRWISRSMAAWSVSWPKAIRRSLTGLIGLLIALAALSTGRDSLAESRAQAGLAAAPGGARNVLLLVLDTVRAESLSLYGYRRPTSPHLARWAQKGVRFEWAQAPAPWTFPSHATFFTGQWPYKLMSYLPQWQGRLGTTYPTVAEYLASRGYLTAGFAANTIWCSYETGLNRGFLHYEDYPLTLSRVLGSHAMGRWLIDHTGDPRDFYRLKWNRFQSRNAPGINHAFLDWLSHQRPEGRPFFAFLNYLDAHDPYLLPAGAAGHFGLAPQSPRDYQMLLKYWELDKRRLGQHDVALAHDAYDDCVAYLDRQVGSLLEELEKRGVLKETAVIITSDHGEEFGEHGLYGHSAGLYVQETHVPLLIIAPDQAPAGRVVHEPVSLRDLAMTLVDLAGQKPGAPFPGSSLTACWRSGTGAGQAPVSPAISDHANSSGRDFRKGPGATQRGFCMALLAPGGHYILDSEGDEELYDVQSDPLELNNLAGLPQSSATIRARRQSLSQALRQERPSGPEEYYLKQYRTWLEMQVLGRPLALGHPPGQSQAPAQRGA